MSDACASLDPPSIPISSEKPTILKRKGEDTWDVFGSAAIFAKRSLRERLAFAAQIAPSLKQHTGSTDSFFRVYWCDVHPMPIVEIKMPTWQTHVLSRAEVSTHMLECSFCLSGISVGTYLKTELHKSLWVYIQQGTWFPHLQTSS